MEKGGKIVDLRFVSQMIISSYLRKIRTLYLKVFFLGVLCATWRWGRSEPKAHSPVKGYVQCRPWLGVFPVSL